MIDEIGKLSTEIEFINQRNEILDKSIKEVRILIKQIKPTVDQEKQIKFKWNSSEQTDYQKVFGFHKKQ